MADLYQPNRDWENLARKVVQPQQIVLVIGAMDIGKSTFCRFLVERGVTSGLRVGFVDADVGQSQIGPPTTIGLKVFAPNDSTESAVPPVACPAPGLGTDCPDAIGEHSARET